MCIPRCKQQPGFVWVIQLSRRTSGKRWRLSVLQIAKVKALLPYRSPRSHHGEAGTFIPAIWPSGLAPQPQAWKAKTQTLQPGRIPPQESPASANLPVFCGHNISRWREINSMKLNRKLKHWVESTWWSVIVICINFSWQLGSYLLQLSPFTGEQRIFFFWLVLSLSFSSHLTVALGCGCVCNPFLWNAASKSWALKGC